MGSATAFTPAKLVIPTLLSANVHIERVVETLTRELGRLDYRSEEIPFTFTKYYTPEMGNGIRRVFFSVEELVDPGRLAELKLHTDEIEAAFAEGEGGGAGRRGAGGTTAGGRGAGGTTAGGGRRCVNLDPGLLTLGRLILASTKDNAQRIPLRDGIYAEVTLLYKSGTFEPLRWTYPDYRSEAYHRILAEIRTLYKQQLEARG